MKNSRIRSAPSDHKKPSIGLVVPALLAMAVGWTGCSAGGGSPAPSNDTGGAGGAFVQNSGGGSTFQGSSGGDTGNSSGGFPTSGTGGGGSGVVQLDGGQIHNESVDPSVQFNWSVDDPNPPLSCQPGHYRGTFTGFYGSPYLFTLPIPVLGDVQMYLKQGQNGEFLTITDGRVTGTVDGALAQYNCKITGTLDCTQKKIVGGAITCEYCVGFFLGDADHPICGAPGYFKRPLGADYDAANQSLDNGKWKGKEGADAATAGGSGDWTANYTGP